MSLNRQASAPAARREFIAEDAPSLAARALRAMRAGRLDSAWLAADRLCRISAGGLRVDALLLRSALSARRGDSEGGRADLRAAAALDPHSPAVNRALLESDIASEREAAARRLLQAPSVDDRHRGCDALGREGCEAVACLEIEKGRLSGWVAWKGTADLRLVLRTDAGEREMRPKRGDAPPPGFDHAGRIAGGWPPGAWAATLVAPNLRLCAEPRTLALPQRPAPPVAASSRPANELLVVVPVYDNREATRVSLESLLAAAPVDRPIRIVAVDDASPDVNISAYLDALTAEGRIELIRNPINMGFAASINRALTLRAAGQDVLLLNADTLIPPGAIDGMTRHLQRSADVGSVTPLSNNGEDTSFPQRFRANPLPSAAEIARLHEIASSANAGAAIDMPNGVGFCLILRGAVLDRLDSLPLAYGRGYYEDVSFCLKIAEAGYRNVAATDVFVGHHGGLSFGDDKRALVARNLVRLTVRHPAYPEQAKIFERSDPLKARIARIEENWLRRQADLDLVVLSADAPALVAESLAQQRESVILRVAETAGEFRIGFAGGDGRLPQNVSWTCAHDEEAILQRLSALSISSALIVETNDATCKLARALKKLGVSMGTLTPAAKDDLGRERHDGGPVARARSKAPELTAPKLRKKDGALVLVGLPESREDAALLAALAQMFRGSAERPALIIASDYRRPIPSPAIHVAGRIADGELPEWLSRAGAQAVLFADRAWSWADPRFQTWAAAGLAVAGFDERSDTKLILRALSLPRDAGAADSARRIGAWLKSLQS